MSFIIRNYKPQDYQMIRDWGNKESWNEGKFDHLAFRILDKNTFWIGQLDGKPIVTLCGAQYDQNFAFIGLYLCLPEYRGKGYGLKVWKHTLSHLTAKNIALEGVPAQESNYVKSGFKTNHKTIVFKVKGTSKQHQSLFLVDCNEVNFQKLLAFDRKHFPAERKQFLKQWINLPESKAIAFVENGQIQGYGVLRVSFEGYRLGPLFATRYEVAQEILKGLVGAAQEGKSISIDVPEVNKEAIKLTKQFNMEQVFRYARMYTNEQPDVGFDKEIYGVTSLEFG